MTVRGRTVEAMTGLVADTTDAFRSWFDVLIVIAVVLFLAAAWTLRKSHRGYLLVSLGFAVLSAAFLFRE